MKKESFDESLVDLQDSLSRFANSLTSNRDESEDLVHDTFLKVLTSKNQFVDSNNLRAWAFTIMRNTFISNYRKKVKHTINFESNNQQLFNQVSYSYSDISNKNVGSEPEFRVPFQTQTTVYKLVRSKVASMFTL